LISIDLWSLEIDPVDFSKFRIKSSKISVQQEIIFGMACLSPIAATLRMSAKQECLLICWWAHKSTRREWSKA